MSTKWTYHKERSFANNYLIFLKILFQFKNLFPVCIHKRIQNKNKSDDNEVNEDNNQEDQFPNVLPGFVCLLVNLAS